MSACTCAYLLTWQMHVAGLQMSSHPCHRQQPQQCPPAPCTYGSDVLCCQGADAPLSGLVAMLAAAQVLGNGTKGIQSWRRRLVFGAMAGEPWGLMGSRRLLLEMQQGTNGTQGLALNRIEQVWAGLLNAFTNAFKAVQSSGGTATHEDTHGMVSAGMVSAIRRLMLVQAPIGIGWRASVLVCGHQVLLHGALLHDSLLMGYPAAYDLPSSMRSASSQHQLAFCT